MLDLAATVERLIKERENVRAVASQLQRDLAGTATSLALTIRRGNGDRFKWEIRPS